MRNLCIDCKKEVKSHNRVVLRCRNCRDILLNSGNFKRENSNAWKGGRVKDKYGYIRVHIPEHPSASNGYVKEHRLVMEKHIGRYLLRGEIVHHINGIKDDNRIENLKLMGLSEHALTHIKERSNFNKKQGGMFLECIVCKKTVWKHKYYIENKYKSGSKIAYQCRDCGGGGRKKQLGNYGDMA